ncbi:MAG: type II secretion system protein [Sedimentisphaerales bacterium]|nr:type II secretion system protein [Sedimentisphaerales bacterium]
MRTGRVWMGDKRPYLRQRGFTIIELLVVIAIISMLMAILVPSLSKIKRQAGSLLGASRQRQTTGSLSVFAFDHDDWFPDSVATIGSASNWNWQEPMMLTGYRARSPRLHRSMGEYLAEYIEDASMLYCPNAPQKYKYLQDVWEAGDTWDNPETGPQLDPASGTYCFFWGYMGYLEPSGRLFRGPTRSHDSGRSLMISDYFGFDHHRSRLSFASCEKIKGSSVAPGTPLSSAFWARRQEEEDLTKDDLQLCLNAAFADGHVEKYSPQDTMTMRVIWKVDTAEPYPPGLGPGEFFLPQLSSR